MNKKNLKDWLNIQKRNGNSEHSEACASDSAKQCFYFCGWCSEKIVTTSCSSFSRLYIATVSSITAFDHLFSLINSDHFFSLINSDHFFSLINSDHFLFLYLFNVQSYIIILHLLFVVAYLFLLMLQSLEFIFSLLLNKFIYYIPNAHTFPIHVGWNSCPCFTPFISCYTMHAYRMT